MNQPDETKQTESPAAPPRVLWTVPEAADRLRLSESTVKRLVKARRLARVKIGHRTLFRTADLDAFAAACLEPAAA